MTMCILLFAQDHSVLARGGGRGGRSGSSADISFSGDAILRTPNGDVTVDASECPGGCAIDKRCQVDIPESTAKSACTAHRYTQAIGSLVFWLLMTAGYIVFAYKFMYPILCRGRGRKTKDGKYEPASHVNQEGTPIGEWPGVQPTNFIDSAPV